MVKNCGKCGEENPPISPLIKGIKRDSILPHNKTISHLLTNPFKNNVLSLNAPQFPLQSTPHQTRIADAQPYAPRREKLWYEFLSSHRIRFLRRRPIGNNIVDFYSASRKLAIEIDGDAHYTEEGIEYDQKRTDFFKGHNISVIRFTNTEVLHSFDAFSAIIAKVLV